MKSTGGRTRACSTGVFLNVTAAGEELRCPGRRASSGQMGAQGWLEADQAGRPARESEASKAKSSLRAWLAAGEALCANEADVEEVETLPSEREGERLFNCALVTPRQAPRQVVKARVARRHIGNPSPTKSPSPEGFLIGIPRAPCMASARSMRNQSSAKARLDVSTIAISARSSTYTSPKTCSRGKGLPGSKRLCTVNAQQDRSCRR